MVSGIPSLRLCLVGGNFQRCRLSSLAAEEHYFLMLNRKGGAEQTAIKADGKAVIASASVGIS